MRTWTVWRKKTRASLPLLLAGTLSACSSYTPRANPWPDLALEPVAIAAPLELPAWPALERCGEAFCLSQAAADQLLEYSDIAESNTVIATELGAAVEDYAAAHALVLEAGEAEHQLAELRGLMLEEERRARKWEAIGHYLLIGVLGIAAASN